MRRRDSAGRRTCGNWLAAATVALLLPVAGGCGRGDHSPVVACWNGGNLTLDDHESWRRVNELEAGPDAIREQVFVLSMAAAAREHGAEQELRTRLEIEDMRHQLLAQALHDHVTAEVTVGDDEVEALLQENPDALQKPRKLHLRNIYKHLGDEPEAAATRARMAQIHAQLVAGADFVELARRESESQSRFRDGNLGFLDPEKLAPEVAEAVSTLAEGQLSGVVEHGDGLSIFRCEEVREGVERSADEVRTRLHGRLVKQRSRKRWAEYQDQLLAEAAVRIEPGSSDTVLDVEGYRLSSSELSELVSLKRRGAPPSGLSESQLEELLRNWALGELVARRAEELGLAEDPEIAGKLSWRRIGVLAHRELVRRIDERLEEPEEDELRRWFEDNPRRYHEPAAFELAVIQFGTGEDGNQRELVETATSVALAVASGELSFDDAARRHSTHPSASEGGFIGWRTSRQLGSWGGVAAAALRQLRPGENSGLIRLESGLWIFEMRDRRDARALTFEEARERVEHDLRWSRIRKLEKVIREEQLEAIDLKILEQPEAAA